MNPSQATAAGAGGVAGALGIIVVWALSLGHVEVPPEVALAFSVVLTPLVHWAGLRLGTTKADKPPVVETKS
jgi:hypothetical protein